MRLLVAAPDKFRGTASAREAAEAIAAAASRQRIDAATFPMSDGGEGFLDALGGSPRTSTVRGPLGEPVVARWSVLDDGTAVIESAEAAGRALLAHPRGRDSVRASTYGVGELLAAAVRDGASSIVVGCGGTASTDGGSGCIGALDALGVRLDVPLVAACDVTVRFSEAASRFGPQKGASAAQVTELEDRLDALSATYLDRFGVDVGAVEGTGAAGGLAGGLVALGAAVRDGAGFVASATGLREAIDVADLVVTGEGAVDEGTLAGKVVGFVLSVRAEVPALVVAGRIDPRALGALRSRRTGRIDALELPGELQRDLGAAEAITTVVEGYLEGTG